MLASSPLLLAVAACGDGDDDPFTGAPPPTSEAEDETEAGLLPCAENRHLVAFDVMGFLTQENIESLGPWLEGVPPTPRAGSTELVQTYREKGYEVLYITTIPPDFFGARTATEVVNEWLQASGYPLGNGTHFWAWDGQERPDGQTWVNLTDELLRFSSEGVGIDFSYTENTDKTYAFATGGVPPEGNFTLTPVEGLGEGTPTSAPTTLIPNDDLVAHTTTVQQLPPVCQVG
ncbi:MAG: LNS2 domain-containing protein [Acidimicrobiales bacterium]